MRCFRCLRKSHFARNCFARTNVYGAYIESDSSDESDADLSYHNSKKRLRYTSSSQSISVITTTSLQDQENPRAGVYVLKTVSGLYYVGKSNDIDARIIDHRNGLGAACLAGTGRFEVISSLLTSGSAADLESWERNETLQRMKTHGIDNVRGWMFTATVLSDDDRRDAFRQICEKYDLCRRCGRDSHFLDQCFASSAVHWAGRII